MWERFESLMLSNGVTMGQVERETGVSKGTISRWKNGITSPKTSTMQILADYFGVSLDYLAGNDKKTHNPIHNPLTDEMLVLLQALPPQWQEEYIRRIKKDLELLDTTRKK